MSAIYTDAADIPPALPHPTGAATAINFHCVVPPFFTSTPSPTAPAATSPSSTSASDCYYSDPSSSSSASPSRSASRDSQLPPSPRNFSLEAHQAEYRTHAYLANESIVKTKLAADKFLQNLFKTQTEPDKDILRAASAASRARLQNPFAYNTTRSSGSSGSSGSSSGSSGYYSGSSGSSGSSYSRSSSNSSTPSTSTAPAPRGTAILGGLPLDSTEPTTPASTEAADIDQPLTEADFTGCIKLEDALSNTAPRGTAIPGGLPLDSKTPATPYAKTTPSMTVPSATAAQPNPLADESPAASSTPKSPSDLAIWPFENLAISPPQPPCLSLATWQFNHPTIAPVITSWPNGP